MSAEDPPELFHYTNAAGIYGIFKEKQIRATSLQYMNDRRELILAVERIIPMLKARAKNADNSVWRYLLYIADAFSRDLLNEDPDLREPVTVCAISFSAQSDLLSQWRAYGGSDGGYALGLRTADVREYITVPGNLYGWRLEKCLYNSYDQELHLAKVIEDLVEQINRADTVNILEEFWARFLYTAALFKDAGFQEEEEWRLVGGRVRVSDLSFRYTRSMIVPYQSLTLDLGLVISRIKVGPHPHAALARAAVRAYASKALELLSVDVETSTIPYRVM